MKKILWIMGPTSSGKTSIAENLINELNKKQMPAIHYDGDEVRDFFGENLGFTGEDRLRVVKTIVHLSNKALSAGLNVIVSALTANENARAFIKENVNNLKIIYIECSIGTCIQRDPKSLYKKAIDCEISTLIGINQEYKPMDNPDFIMNTEDYSIRENVSQLIDRFF